MKPKPRTKATTHYEYLSALNADQRAALEKLRRTIKAAAPMAEECISYQLAAYRLNGKPLVAFGATANHCAFYLMSSTTAASFADELQKLDTSKGTIRFQPHTPLPAALVRRLVKARILENPAAGSNTLAAKSGRTRSRARQKHKPAATPPSWR